MGKEVPRNEGKARRNTTVESAVHRAIDRVDYFIAGGQLRLPNNVHRRACDTLLAAQRASVKLATMFFLFYWLEDRAWDGNILPRGVRGPYGDKWLSEQLSHRHITLHDNITAFAENLGWKGNVEGVRLKNDPRFKSFLGAVKGASEKELARIADYFAERFAASKRETIPLPPVGAEVLTFARAKYLFHELLKTQSEGFIQQFLIAGLLHEYRKRHMVEVRTRHPHAADRSDDAAGDIEEFHDGRLIQAYDVTVRPDWQSRLTNYRSKMDRFGLSRYVIIASGVNEDSNWSQPAKMVLALEPVGRDIAVVDISDVANVLAVELAPLELRAAINKAFEYLSSRKLGRDDYKELFANVVSDWLDTAETE
jgi:hypothetical protein